MTTMADAAADFDLEDVIQAYLRAFSREMHTTMPGQVVKYDPATQTADIQPVVRVQYTNQDAEAVSEAHPICPNVPIRWPAFGPFVIVGTLVPGDHVDLHFCEADPAVWRTNGQVSDPADARTHSLSYAYATLGARPDASPLADGAVAGGSPARFVIGVADSDIQIVFSEDQLIQLGRGATDFVALASLVDARIAAIRSAFNAHTHATVTSLGTPTPPVVLLPAQAPVAATKAKAL